MINKEKIRPIYTRLQGYLDQAPKLINPYDNTDDESLWIDFHKTLEELKELTQKNYTKFTIPLEPAYSGGNLMKISSYRAKLSGLINELYGEYFSDEISPMGKVPTTIIQQSQTQSQSTLIQLIVDISSKIEKGILDTEDQNEKDFLGKLKENLPTITNAIQLIGLMLNLANQYGISIFSLNKFFGL